MAEREILGKLALKDLGNPANVKTMSPVELEKAGNKYVMGMLIGRANDLVERTDPKTDEKFEGLAGTFIMRPLDPTLAEKESGILWIPDAFHNLVSAKLREVQKADPNADVEFAFEVAAIPAKNPAGYSWSFTPAIPFEGKHPLEDMMKRVEAAKKPALAAPDPKAAAKK